MGEDCKQCEYHQDIKDQLKMQNQMNQDFTQWQIKFGEKFDTMLEEMKASRECQAELKKNISQILINLAGSYVTKQDFTEHKSASEERIKRVHERLDEILREQKHALWKVITLMVPIMTAVIAFMQWIFSII